MVSRKRTRLGIPRKCNDADFSRFCDVTATKRVNPYGRPSHQNYPALFAVYQEDEKFQIGSTCSLAISPKQILKIFISIKTNHSHPERKNFNEEMEFTGTGKKSPKYNYKQKTHLSVYHVICIIQHNCFFPLHRRRHYF
jgi:hypothetical protein